MQCYVFCFCNATIYVFYLTTIFQVLQLRRFFQNLFLEFSEFVDAARTSELRLLFVSFLFRRWSAFFLGLR